MIENMSAYQIGTKPGHRAQEHLFVIKSVMSLAELIDTAIALQLWDLAKYFDRESLADGLNELYKNNVRGKLYKLLFELNKDTRISVRTAVGDTEQRETGEGWGQGTIEGAICSAVNLDNGVRDFFCNSEHEVSYGGVRLLPALFQDDVSRICMDPVSAQAGNNKMEAMAETKLLDFNLDKSCFIIIGKTKARQKLECEFALNPPLLYGTKMKQVEQEKYLGDQVSFGGLAASVMATIVKRKGKVIQSIFEIKAVIDDCRSHVTGGLETGLELWEMAVIPFVMNNCGSWVGHTSKEVTELEKLQNLFYRVLLEVPVGCPTPMLYWDCGGLLMENRILKNKLMLIHHIATLGQDSLAYQVYEEQRKLQLPDLLQECQDFLIKFKIQDFNVYTKGQWKTLIKKQIKIKNQNDLLLWMKRYSKIDQSISEETFEIKPYIKQLSISLARDKFRLRSHMMRTVKMNFSSDKKYMADLWRCWHCPCVDSQAHIQICPAYQQFREGKDMNNDKDLVEFYRKVIKMRDDNN